MKSSTSAILEASEELSERLRRSILSDNMDECQRCVLLMMKQVTSRDQVHAILECVTATKNLGAIRASVEYHAEVKKPYQIPLFEQFKIVARIKRLVDKEEWIGLIAFMVDRSHQNTQEVKSMMMILTDDVNEDELRQGIALANNPEIFKSHMLQYAIDFDSLPYIKVLVEKFETNVNLRGAFDQYTPIAYAASRGFLDHVLYLHQQGAIVFLGHSNDLDSFAAYAAFANDYYQVGCYLVDHLDGDPYLLLVRDTQQGAALYDYAKSKDYTDVCKFINERTALAYAVKKFQSHSDPINEKHHTILFLEQALILNDVRKCLAYVSQITGMERLNVVDLRDALALLCRYEKINVIKLAITQLAQRKGFLVLGPNQQYKLTIFLLLVAPYVNKMKPTEWVDLVNHIIRSVGILKPYEEGMRDIALGKSLTAEEMRALIASSGKPASWWMYLAAALGASNVVLLLMTEFNVTPTMVDKSDDCLGETPILAAVKNGHDAVVDLMMMRTDKSHVNQRQPNGYFEGATLLFVACIYGHQKVAASLIINHGADITLIMTGRWQGLTSFFAATICEQHDILKLLKSHGANLNEETTFTFALNGTPLMYAAFKGRKALAMVLLDLGADIHYRHSLACYKGYTALSHAASKNQLDIIRLLVSRGAVTYRQGTLNGEWPAYVAGLNGCAEAFMLLVDELKGDPDNLLRRGTVPGEQIYSFTTDGIIRVCLQRRTPVVSAKKSAATIAPLKPNKPKATKETPKEPAPPTPQQLIESILQGVASKLGLHYSKDASQQTITLTVPSHSEKVKIQGQLRGFEKILKAALNPNNTKNFSTSLYVYANDKHITFSFSEESKKKTRDLLTNGKLSQYLANIQAPLVEVAPEAPAIAQSESPTLSLERAVHKQKVDAEMQRNISLIAFGGKLLCENEMQWTISYAGRLKNDDLSLEVGDDKYKCSATVIADQIVTRLNKAIKDGNPFIWNKASQSIVFSSEAIQQIATNKMKEIRELLKCYIQHHGQKITKNPLGFNGSLSQNAGGLFQKPKTDSSKEEASASSSVKLSPQLQPGYFDIKRFLLLLTGKQPNCGGIYFVPYQDKRDDRKLRIGFDPLQVSTLHMDDEGRAYNTALWFYHIAQAMNLIEGINVEKVHYRAPDKMQYDNKLRNFATLTLPHDVYQAIMSGQLDTAAFREELNALAALGAFETNYNTQLQDDDSLDERVEEADLSAVSRPLQASASNVMLYALYGLSMVTLPPALDTAISFHLKRMSQLLDLSRSIPASLAPMYARAYCFNLMFMFFNLKRGAHFASKPDLEKFCYNMRTLFRVAGSRNDTLAADTENAIEYLTYLNLNTSVFYSYDKTIHRTLAEATDKLNQRYQEMNDSTDSVMAEIDYAKNLAKRIEVSATDNSPSYNMTDLLNDALLHSCIRIYVLSKKSRQNKLAIPEGYLPLLAEIYQRTGHYCRLFEGQFVADYREEYKKVMEGFVEKVLAMFSPSPFVHPEEARSAVSKGSMNRKG